MVSCCRLARKPGLTGAPRFYLQAVRRVGNPLQVGNLPHNDKSLDCGAGL
jgi:hypothetical protein